MAALLAGCGIQDLGLTVAPGPDAPVATSAPPGGGGGGGFGPACPVDVQGALEDALDELGDDSARTLLYPMVHLMDEEASGGSLTMQETQRDAFFNEVAELQDRGNLSADEAGNLRDLAGCWGH